MVQSALGVADQRPCDVALTRSPATATQALLYSAVGAELLVFGS
jgi:hypothetical protein